MRIFHHSRHGKHGGNDGDAASENQNAEDGVDGRFSRLPQREKKSVPGVFHALGNARDCPLVITCRATLVNLLWINM